jgi:uridine kinase
MQTIKTEPREFVIVDGILILSQPHIRVHFNESVFVDTSEQLRFHRRLKRDVEERGRTPEGVQNQFFKQVKPMHDLFVEPSKSHASFVVVEDQDFSEQLNHFLKNLRV